MVALKTLKNKNSVSAFVKALQDEGWRKDSLAMLKIFKATPGQKTAMLGASSSGYGSYHHKSERSAQEGDWPMTGFSPRKQNMTVYIMPGFKKYQPLLKKIGKHKTSVSCVY